VLFCLKPIAVRPKRAKPVEISLTQIYNNFLNTNTMSKIIEDKKQFTTRISADIIELINEFIEVYEQQYGVNLDSDRKVFEALIESALSKKKPIEVSKTEDIQEIEMLKKELENELIKSDTLKRVNVDLENHVSALKTELKQAENKAQTLVKIEENQIIVSLSKFHKKLINTYLLNKEIISEFNKMNRSGELDGVFDRIDRENKSENISNLLTTVFVGSTAGKVLKPVLSKKQIENEIKKYINGE